MKTKISLQREDGKRAVIELDAAPFAHLIEALDEGTWIVTPTGTAKENAVIREVFECFKDFGQAVRWTNPTLIDDVNSALPKPWKVEKQPDGRFSACFGNGVKQADFDLPEEAQEWIQAQKGGRAAE